PERAIEERQRGVGVRPRRLELAERIEHVDTLLRRERRRFVEERATLVAILRELAGEEKTFDRRRPVRRARREITRVVPRRVVRRRVMLVAGERLEVRGFRFVRRD